MYFFSRNILPVYTVNDYPLIILNIVQMCLLANAEVEETLPLTLDLIVKRLRNIET